MKRAQQGHTRRYVAVFLLMAVLFPVGIVVHELGHFFAGKALGLNTTLNATSVGYTYTLEPPLHTMLLFLIAGVFCDVVFVTAGLAWLQRQRHRFHPVDSLAGWVATTLMVYSVRWSLAPLFVALGKSDEGFMSEILGMGRWAIPLATIAIGVPIAAFVMKLHIEQKTGGMLAVGVLGAFCGAGMWAIVIGPFVL